jgi:hypothetical protein
LIPRIIVFSDFQLYVVVEQVKQQQKPSHQESESSATPPSFPEE